MTEQSLPAKRQRPLSPHLQVYKPQLTSAMSIFHRITGAALAYGVFLFAWLLIAAATGPEAFAQFTGFCGTLIGKLLLAGWALSFYYHMFNGVRHLFWDMGYLMTIKKSYRAGYIVLALTILMTVYTWSMIF